MLSVKKMRRRRSGTLNMLRTAARNFSIEPAQAFGMDVLLSADYSCGAAGFLDLLASASRKAVGGNLERLLDLAVSQHDDVMFCLLDDSASVQKGRSDLVVLSEMFFERFQAHLGPSLLEDVGEATLGQAPMQGHLAALETNFRRIAGTRLLAFFTTAGGLSQSRAWSAAHALLFVGGTFCGV